MVQNKVYIFHVDQKVENSLPCMKRLLDGEVLRDHKPDWSHICHIIDFYHMLSNIFDLYEYVKFVRH